MTKRRRRRNIAPAARPDAAPETVPPTPERRRHSIIIALPSGAMMSVSETEAQYGEKHGIRRAIHRYVRSWEVGTQQQRSDAPGEGGGRGYASGGISEARLMAVMAYEDAGRAIGPTAHSLLTLALCQAVSVLALARRLGHSEKTIKRRIAVALENLADHYREHRNTHIAQS